MKMVSEEDIFGDKLSTEILALSTLKATLTLIVFYLYCNFTMIIIIEICTA